jgi:hypothetical protein
MKRHIREAVMCLDTAGIRLKAHSGPWHYLAIFKVRYDLDHEENELRRACLQALLWDLQAEYYGVQCSETQGSLPDDDIPEWVWDVDGAGTTGFVFNRSNRPY